MRSERSGYLSSYRPAPFTFSAASAPRVLSTLWKHLAGGDTRNALAESRRLLREKSVRDKETLAGLLVGAAAAELGAGNPRQAVPLVKRSLSLLPHQWMAHAIRIEAYEALQAPERAHRYSISITLAEEYVGWDEPRSRAETHTLIASLAWRVGAWDDVAKHLTEAYPHGVATMPGDLRGDWFRLAFYRTDPDEAAEAARAILPDCSIDQLDTLLNAMVQHGWTSEALPLYRDAFAIHADSQLLRRRLVGLCIREGALDEARELASSGALNIVV